MEIIDGYAHCGLRTYRRIEAVRQVMQQCRVSRTVLVQHFGEYDNNYIGGIVAAEPDRFAGVFLVDTEADNAHDEIARWAGSGAFRGIRFPARTIAPASQLWDHAAELGLNILINDMPTMYDHLHLLPLFLSRHPETPLVLTHFGTLDLREAPHFESYNRILALARFPNTYLQISGMHMYGEYPYQELAALAAQALEVFGPERLLYGSNYPVMKDDDIYRLELELLLSGEFGVPPEHLAQVVCRTAVKLWFAAP